MVYSIFAEGAVLEQKFAKQNGLFEEFLHTYVYHHIRKLLWDTMVTRRKPFLKNPPLLAANFKFMSEIVLFVVQFILNH